VKVEAKPWQRITTATGEPHDHGVAAAPSDRPASHLRAKTANAVLSEPRLCAGFMMTGTELRTTYVTFDEAGKTEVVSGECPSPLKQSRGSILCASRAHAAVRCPLVTFVPPSQTVRKRSKLMTDAGVVFQA